MHISPAFAIDSGAMLLAHLNRSGSLIDTANYWLKLVPLPQEVVEAPRDLLWSQRSPVRPESHGGTTDTIVSGDVVGWEVSLPSVDR